MSEARCRVGRWTLGSMIMALLVAACATVPSRGPTAAQNDVPTQRIMGYQLPIDSVAELYEMSNLVLVGEFTGVRREVFVQPPDGDEVMAGVEPLLETVYDGLAFRPVEMIKGGVGDEVVVRVPSGLRDAKSRKLISRLIPNSYPISQADVGHRYLLFLSNKYTKEYGLWNYVSGPFGVSEVRGDGTLKVSGILTGTGPNPVAPYDGRNVDDLIDVLRSYGP